MHRQIFPDCKQPICHTCRHLSEISFMYVRGMCAKLGVHVFLGNVCRQHSFCEDCTEPQCLKDSPADVQTYSRAKAVAKPL